MTLPDDVRKLIDGPNFAHLCTLMPDGALSLLLPSGARRAITAGEVFFAPA